MNIVLNPIQNRNGFEEGRENSEERCNIQKADSFGTKLGGGIDNCKTFAFEIEGKGAVKTEGRDKNTEECRKRGREFNVALSEDNVQDDQLKMESERIKMFGIRIGREGEKEEVDKEISGNKEEEKLEGHEEEKNSDKKKVFADSCVQTGPPAFRMVRFKQETGNGIRLLLTQYLKNIFTILFRFTVKILLFGLYGPCCCLNIFPSHCFFCFHTFGSVFLW